MATTCVVPVVCDADTFATAGLAVSTVKEDELAKLPTFAKASVARMRTFMVVVKP